MSGLLCVTIDTEPDCDVRWRRSSPLTFESILRGIKETLHSLLVDCGARPTYLLSPEVLNHPGSVEVLGALRGCELGAHLHAEYIGPATTHPDPAGTRSSQFPCELASDVEYGKLRALTDLFRSRFGFPPTSYRAARFGADGDTFCRLAELGYTVDSSVTPNITWAGSGGPDFRGCRDQPYWLLERRLLEVPVTIGGKRLPFLPDRWIWYRWLRPSIMTALEMRHLARHFERRYGDATVLTMMFHSMEITPKASPYVRTTLGRKLFLARLRNILAFLGRRGFAGRTLREVRDAWD